MNRRDFVKGAAAGVGAMTVMVGGTVAEAADPVMSLNVIYPNKEGAKKFIAWLASPEAIELYAKAGGSPAVSEAIAAKISADRPDLVKLGEYAGQYGFVMNGATSAKTLQVYELQAKEFTAYWSGEKSLDDALAATAAGMAELLKQ